MAEWAEPIGDKTTSRSLIVVLCLAVAMLEGYDIQAVGVAAPRMVPALGLSPGETGWVFSASIIGLMVGAAIGGWFADRIGRRPVLIGSVIMFGLFSLVTVWAADYPTLLLCRILTGLGLGGAIPNVIAVIAEISPPARRTSFTTMVFCGMPLGGAMAAAFAGYAFGQFDWRMIFLVGGVIPLALAPLFVLKMPETKPPEGRAADRSGRQSVLTVLFGNGQLVTTLLIWLSFFLTLVVMYLLLNWLPTLAVAKGLSRSAAAGASVAFNLGSVPGALLLGVVVDRVGLRWPMVAAFSLLVVIMMTLSGATGALAIISLSAAAGFVVVGSLYVLYAILANYYPASARGTGSGAAVAAGRLGSVVGPMIAGQLLNAGASAEQVLTFMVPVSLAAGIAITLLTVIGRPLERDPIRLNQPDR